MQTTYDPRGGVTTTTRNRGGGGGVLTADLISALLRRRKSQSSSAPMERSSASTAATPALNRGRYVPPADGGGQEAAYVQQVGGPNTVPGLVRTSAGPGATFGGMWARSAAQQGPTSMVGAGAYQAPSRASLAYDDGSDRPAAAAPDETDKWYGLPEFVRRKRMEQASAGGRI